MLKIQEIWNFGRDDKIMILLADIIHNFYLWQESVYESLSYVIKVHSRDFIIVLSMCLYKCQILITLPDYEF